MSCAPAPPQDQCAGALAIPLGTTSLNNNGATKNTNCIAQADIYLTHTSTCTGTVTVTFVASFGLQAAKFSSTCTTPEVACTSTSPYTLSFPTTAGTKHYFAVGSSGNTHGPFSAIVYCGNPPTPARSPSYYYNYPTPQQDGATLNFGSGSSITAGTAVDPGVIAGIVFVLFMLIFGTVVLIVKQKQKDALKGTVAHAVPMTSAAAL